MLFTNVMLHFVVTSSVVPLKIPVGRGGDAVCGALEGSGNVDEASVLLVEPGDLERGDIVREGRSALPILGLVLRTYGIVYLRDVCACSLDRVL